MTVLTVSRNVRRLLPTDEQRPRKKVAYVLDIGRAVKPYLTPTDPGGFESALSAWCSVPIESGGRGRFI